MEILFLIGRIIFGLFFIMMGFNHFKNRSHMVAYGKMKGVPLANLAVPVTGLMMILGGLGVILGAYVYVSLVLLLAFLVPTTLVMHQFWKEADPQARMMERINFTKNLALIGAILMMFELGAVWVLAL